MRKSIPLSFSPAAQQIQTLLHSWYLDAVLIPFGATRLIYLLIAWFAKYYLAFDHYYVARGYFLTPYPLLDIWCRWDSAHYFSIITQGYTPSADLTKISSNVAFFPLYPYLAKSISWVLPSLHVPLSLYIAVGLLISNVSFLIAAGLLYRLIVRHVADEAVARHTLLLVFAFPTSFIFSCFYTESLFLVLALASLTLALEHRWLWACLAAGLLSVTRFQGILIAVPLVWIYLQSIQWNLRRLRPDFLSMALIPLPVGLYFLSLYPLTGSLWSPLLAEQAWGRNGNLLTNLIGVFQPGGIMVNQVDAVVAALFVGITLWGVWKLTPRYLGVYALLLTVVPISSGLIGSFTRYAVVVFPAFISLAMLLKRRSLEMSVLALFMALQAVYFLGWVNYYWID
jgi:hypothetical protein